MPLHPTVIVPYYLTLSWEFQENHTVTALLRAAYKSQDVLVLCPFLILDPFA